MAGKSQLKREVVEEIQRLGRDGKTVAEIASMTEVSRASVSKYLKAAGIDAMKCVDKAVNARMASVKTRQVKAKERRAALEERFLDETESILDKLHSPVIRDYAINAQGGQIIVYEADEPNAKETRDLMNAAGVSMTQALRLADFDADKSASDAKNLLSGLAEAFGIAADSIEAGDGNFSDDQDQESVEVPAPEFLSAEDEQIARVTAETQGSTDTNYNRQLNKRTEKRMADNRAAREKAEAFEAGIDLGD